MFNNWQNNLGLRQAVMALMNWAIDVPQGLLQSDAILFTSIIKIFSYFDLILFVFWCGGTVELIIKKSYIYLINLI